MGQPQHTLFYSVTVNKEEARSIVEENLQMLEQLSVPEYTLYRKWEQINEMKWDGVDLEGIKRNIWIPKNPDDYKNLNIKVIHADTPEKLEKWRVLRVMTSTAHWLSSPGRLLMFYVVHEEKGKTLDPFGMFPVEDKIDEKYLGVISIASDFMDLTGRDNVIGWSRDLRVAGKTRHTAMGSSIVPTQPLGYNYLGGKLMSLLTASDAIENVWDERYKDKLLGVTTTSLYGGLSQYNSLPYWKKCQSTEGTVALEPTSAVYKIMREYCKENHPEVYNDLIKRSHPKYKVMAWTYKELGVKQRKNLAPRGVYWCPLYTESHDFLRGEKDTWGERKFDNRVDTLVGLWKEKFAKKRIASLIEQDKRNDNTLFYGDLIGMSWEECREKYLADVGVNAKDK